MSMNWERVKGVLESSDKVKEASKVGEEYAHDDYMFVSETKMAVGEEMVDLIQEEAEKITTCWKTTNFYKKISTSYFGKNWDVFKMERNLSKLFVCF